MALETECQTPNCRYNISVKHNEIICRVDNINLLMSEPEVKLLERNLHNALELVLSKYFYDGRQHELKKVN